MQIDGGHRRFGQASGQDGRQRVFESVAIEDAGTDERRQEFFVGQQDARFLAESGVAGAEAASELTGASDNVRIENCEFVGDYSVACVHGDTALSKGLMFLDNLVHNTDAGEPYLEVHVGTTGVIANTRGLAGGATIAANAVADAMAHCENFVVNTAGTIAIIKGAAGSPALDAD